MKPLAIIDLDNCVSNDFWRLSKIDLSHEVVNDRYWDYHEACDKDVPGQVQLMYVRQLAKNYRLLVFTSRPSCVREKTERWLRKWGIPYERLYMRADDDHNSSVNVKLGFYKMAKLDFDPCEIEVAIDDREDILSLYRELGIPRVERIFIVDHSIPLERVAS
jgi:hypothetical protein